jgi:hypothetical protein
MRPRLIIVSAVLLAGTVFWATADAAWTTSATNGPDTWHSGTVTFGANQPTGTLISIANVFPGSFGSACVVVTYTGTLTAPVRLYLPSAGALGTYLTLRVRDGTGTSAGCGDFVATTTLYNPTGLSGTSYTMAAFSAASYNYATGVGAWTASTGNTTRTYRFDWQVQDKNAAEGLTTSVAFTWEAQNS